MICLVDLAMCTWCSGGSINGEIPVGFFDIGLAGAINVFQSCNRVEGECVWPNTHHGTFSNLLFRTGSPGIMMDGGVELDYLPYFLCSCNDNKCRSPLAAWLYIDHPDNLLNSGPGYFRSGCSHKR
jgi:hypothetical protein